MGSDGAGGGSGTGDGGAGGVGGGDGGGHVSEAALAFDEAGLTRLDRLRGAVLLWISPRIFVGSPYATDSNSQRPLVLRGFSSSSSSGSASAATGAASDAGGSGTTDSTTNPRTPEKGRAPPPPPPPPPGASSNVSPTATAPKDQLISNSGVDLLPNLTSCLADGRVLLALLHSADPAECPYNPSPNHTANLETALAEATERFGVPQLVSARDRFFDFEPITVLYLSELVRRLALSAAPTLHAGLTLQLSTQLDAATRRERKTSLALNRSESKRTEAATAADKALKQLGSPRQIRRKQAEDEKKSIKLATLEQEVKMLRAKLAKTQPSSADSAAYASSKVGNCNASGSFVRIGFHIK